MSGPTRDDWIKNNARPRSGCMRNTGESTAGQQRAPVLSVAGPVSKGDREAVYRILGDALGPYPRPVPCLPDEYRIKPVHSPREGSA